MGDAMAGDARPQSGAAGAGQDREQTVRRFTHLTDVEKSFDDMCADLAVATREVSRLTEIAREAVQRLDGSLQSFRQSVARMKSVDPTYTDGQIEVIEANIETFASELANLHMRFGRFQPSIDRTQAAIEQMIRSVVSDAEESVESEVRWMKHSIRKKISEQSLYTNRNIELSAQRVTQKVGESRDYLRNLLYIVLFLIIGSIAAQIYFAAQG